MLFEKAMAEMRAGKVVSIETSTGKFLYRIHKGVLEAQVPSRQWQRSLGPGVAHIVEGDWSLESTTYSFDEARTVCATRDVVLRPADKRLRSTMLMCRSIIDVNPSATRDDLLQALNVQWEEEV